MKRILHKIKERRLLFFVVFLSIICIVYVFVPRNLNHLIMDSKDDIKNITILVCATDTREQKEVTLTETEVKDFMRIAQNSYARKRVFQQKSTSENFVGYYIFIDSSNNPNSNSIYFYTTDLISVNGQQYQLYETTLVSHLKTLVGEEG